MKRKPLICLLMFFVVMMGFNKLVTAGQSWLPVKSGARFVVIPELNNEAVLDRETGLIWEKSPDTTTRTWSDAVYYAYNKTVGGRKGWRLPTVEELASLVDTTQDDPTLPSGHPFTNVQSSGYWSSTTYVDDVSNTFIFIVSFYDDNVYYLYKSLNRYVWCVRGGQGHDGQ